MKQSWDRSGAELARCVVRGAGRVVGRAATKGGGRRPLAWLLDEFFVAIAEELEVQGVSRRVAADLFGMSRRTFVRNLRRAEVGADSDSRTLWATILVALRERARTREAVLTEHAHRQADVLRSILHDLVASGLVTEVDGVLTAVDHSQAWTPERLRTLIATLWGTDSLLPASELAGVVGADVESVSRAMEAFFGQQMPIEVIPQDDDESLHLLLAESARHVLTVVYDELDGRPTRSNVFGVDVFETGADRASLLTDAAERSIAGFEQSFAEVVGAGAPERPTSSPMAKFTAFFSYRLDR